MTNRSVTIVPKGNDKVVEIALDHDDKSLDAKIYDLMRGPNKKRVAFKDNASHIRVDQDVDLLDPLGVSKMMKGEKGCCDCKANLFSVLFGLVAWKLVFILLIWTILVVLLRHYDVLEEKEFTFKEDVSGWGFIVGLLLVFRTNQGMQRWWEARVAWEDVTTNCIEIMRQVQVFGQAHSLSSRTLVLIMAFAVTLKNSLRDKPVKQDEHDRFELTQFLPSAYLEFLMLQKGRSRPRTILDLISGLSVKAAQNGLMDTQVLTRTVEKGIQTLNDNVGRMIRIKTTPIPYAYAVLLRLLNFLYLMVTPIVLTAKGFGLPATVLFTMLFGFSLIAIDETGLQMQDPFGKDVSDLPLEKYCTEIFKQCSRAHFRWHDKTQVITMFDLTLLEPNKGEGVDMFRPKDNTGRKSSK